MRMDTYRRVNPLVRLSQFNRTFERAAVRIACADIEHRRHARVSCARNYLFAIGIVFLAVDVTMGIDEHLNCHHTRCGFNPSTDSVQTGRFPDSSSCGATTVISGYRVKSFLFRVRR